MNILITGDLFISDNFKNRPLIDGYIEKLFHDADYRIVNLEAPLTDNNEKNKITKTGPHLRISADTLLPYLRQLKVDLVTLANNHILDYGSKGLSDTFNDLHDNKISYVGAGSNLKEAVKPFSIIKEGMKIAIMNFTENEWSIAEEDKSGANPLDIIDNVKQIKAIKENHDTVICIIHGGHEFYHLPSPRMVKQYRFYAENGADVIIGHHTHCISGYEVHNNIPIFYSLGNFIFTNPHINPAWYEGLLLKLKLTKINVLTWELIPINQEEDTFIVKEMKGKVQQSTLDQVEKYSQIILDSTMLRESFYKLSQKQKEYLILFSPINAIPFAVLRKVLSKTSLAQTRLSKSQAYLYLNMIRCEAHHDLLKLAIKKLLEEE